jgi:hypothetical protein
LYKHKKTMAETNLTHAWKPCQRVYSCKRRRANEGTCALLPVSFLNLEEVAFISPKTAPKINSSECGQEIFPFLARQNIHTTRGSPCALLRFDFVHVDT